VDRLRVRRPALPLVPARGLVGPLVLVVALATAPAQADQRTDLEKAYSAYVGHKYDEAETRLRALLDPKTRGLMDPDTVADARMYLGAVLVAEARKDDAGFLFEALLVDKPDYEPDPLRVSTEAIDAFLDVRARMRARLASIKSERARKEQEERAKAEADRQREAARVAMLEKLASEEVVHHENSRWIALVPFGVGQFQNGRDGLGGVFLASEAVLAIGSGIGAGLSLAYASQANDALGRRDPAADQYQRYAKQAAWAGNGLAVGFLLVAVAGIVQAELAFLPERVEVRKRALPPQSLAPVTPLVSPGGIGFRF
jgi:hypothetical protein